jgi:DNA-binding NarL/FixJ family response regulator
LKRSWEFPDDQRHLSRRPVGRIRHRRIAQLAADGLTNREIGKRLYISHRTVGAHLAKIYAKLGATSRVQLHSALSAGQEP